MNGRCSVILGKDKCHVILTLVLRIYSAPIQRSLFSPDRGDFPLSRCRTEEIYWTNYRRSVLASFSVKVYLLDDYDNFRLHTIQVRSVRINSFLDYSLLVKSTLACSILQSIMMYRRFYYLRNSSFLKQTLFIYHVC